MASPGVITVVGEAERVAVLPAWADFDNNHRPQRDGPRPEGHD
ncbi:hypothetical protein [Paeniglutamicibacter antarcticus]